ncbi:hypothetical protein DRQ53_15355 [bacterium]|nr:MAG: hypothetical protein DRQ53_15355 [bacterium]
MSRIALLAVCSVVMVASGASADTIYRASNSSSGGTVFTFHDRFDGYTETGSADEQPGGGEESSAVAQRLSFVGSARESSRFILTLGEIMFGAPRTDIDLDVTLELRGAAGDTPGALLWSGTSHAFFQDGSFTYRSTNVSWEPTIVLPDSVFAVISYANIVGQGETALGVSAVPYAVGDFPRPPIIEFYTPDQEWIDSGATQREGYLEFRVTAVPSPGALALLGLAACGRRRR